MNTNKRKTYNKFHTGLDHISESHLGHDHLKLTFSFPDGYFGLTCGAKNRKGIACKRRDIYNNGRCKFHGGLSTGPKTKEGKKRSSLNGLIPKKKRTP